MAIQDSGSNYQFYDKRIFDKHPRSFFDLGHLVTQSADFGKVYCIDYGELLPDSDWQCSITTLIKLLPTVVAPLSRMRVFFHLYTMDYNMLWNHWESFMKKGHDGRQTYEVPTVLFPEDYVVKKGDLCDMLEIPQGLTGTYLNSLGISALPFMMYQSICKYYYTNPVLDYLDNKNLFPDDDDTWRLHDGPQATIPTVDDSKETWNLWDVHYRPYVDDYFTSAMTSPMRGDVPYLSFGIQSSDILEGNITIPADTVPKRFLGLIRGPDRVTAPALFGSLNSDGVAGLLGDGEANTLYGLVQPERTGRVEIPASSLSMSGVITHDQIRGLAIATSILETMARTDGSYREFIQQFYRNTPNTRELKPRYVGGSYSPILVNEVLQTSATANGSTPQGHGAGRGISSTDNFLGKFHSNDFGMYMLCATIMPDTYYHQGIPRHLLRKSQEEYPLPPRMKLGPQEIMNCELFNHNEMPADDSKTGAFGLFGFQNRYDEYRYRQNVVKGSVADSNEEDFYALTQMRDFTTLPTLSNSFVTTKGNINKTFMAVQDSDSFIMQVACRFGAVQPLPYKAVPADFID